ncbi:unnamed protein product [Sphagnum troendelagicum]|uniref:AMP-dependent synthetase/ligase domain-containing protein n=1 Tax=Sphagnum troendelagicum TaxID=128251 RepID=A0ABP0V1G3_9BRYO
MATTEESKSVESLTRVDIVGTGLSSYAAHIFHQELRRVLAEVGHLNTCCDMAANLATAPAARASFTLSISSCTTPLSEPGTLRCMAPHLPGSPIWFCSMGCGLQSEDSDQGSSCCLFLWLFGKIKCRGSARLTNLGQLLESKGVELLRSQYANPIDSYSAFQRWSVQHPERYFQFVFEEESIVFHQQPRCILDTSNEAIPGGQLLPGAALNIAESCLASKGKKTDSSTAIIWHDEGEDELPLKTLTLAHLGAFVSQVANALECLGLQQGDVIAIDMPMNVYAVIAYLAIILAGFVVVSIADSFVHNEIRVRIQISKAKAIFTQVNSTSVGFRRHHCV